MRIPTLTGIGLIALGAFFLIFGGSFTSERNVLDIGGLTVTAEERHPIRPWIAGVVILAGVGLVLTGARHKTIGARP